MRTNYQNLKKSGLSFWQIVEIEMVCYGSIEKALRSALKIWTNGESDRWQAPQLAYEVAQLKTQYERTR